MTRRRERVLSAVMAASCIIIAVVKAEEIIRDKRVIESDDPVSIEETTVAAPDGDLTVRAPRTSLGPGVQVERGARLEAGPKPPDEVVAITVTTHGAENGAAKVEVSRFVGLRYRLVVERQSGQRTEGPWSTTVPAVHRVPIPAGSGWWQAVAEIPGDHSLPDPQPGMWRFACGKIQP